MDTRTANQLGDNDMTQYARDPFWLVAKYRSPCANLKCTRMVEPGERVFYYPNGRSIYCPTHSKEAAADFAACDFDEMVYNA